MRCQERDQDLLLFGLRELPFWRSQGIAWHLRSCLRCRKRHAELADVSWQIAGALRPPSIGGGTGRGPGMHARVHHRPVWARFSPVLLATVAAVLLLTALSVWRMGGRAVPRMSAGEVPCLPGLPSDRCR